MNLFLILSIIQKETEKITAVGQITFDESIYDGEKIPPHHVGES